MDEKKTTSFKNADIKKATEGMRAYLELKNKYPDVILMYRIGDFYETFFEDAQIVSKICDITLTKRKYGELGEVPLAGVPRGSFDIYVKKLLDKNLKIARAEQFKEEDGSCTRKVIRVYTPATIYENEFLDVDKNNYLAAIIKKNGKYGFSYCDVSEGSFYITSGTKEEVFFELMKISPKEILLNSEDLLFDFKDAIESYKNALVDSKYFIQDEIEVLKGDFECGYICANAIVNYLKYTQKTYAPRLDDIKKYSINDFLMLDFNTRRSLELTRMQSDFKKRGSLFWFLDNTKTPMGKRLLKNWMSAPLTDTQKIIKRQRVIKEFCTKPFLCKILDDFLEDFCDILRYSAKISNRTITYKELIEISQVLSRVNTLEQVLRELSGFDIETKADTLNLLVDFSSIINRTFDIENNGNIPIKSGVDARLDLLRDDLETLENKLKNIEANLKEKFQKDIKAKCAPNLGYFFEAPASILKELDDRYFIKQKLTSYVRFMDSQLVDIEEKICSIKYQIEECENNIYEKIKDYCCELTSKIRAFARDVAYLDVINSMRKIVLENKYCPVEFNLDDTFVIKEGVHPCVNKIVENYVPNDIKNEGLLVLTGANMSGKSTYLKQNGVIVILSQMCGFAPAGEVNIYSVDKIFFHGSIFDNFRENESGFMAEMKSISRILKNSTKRSLILLDEPIKGTNSLDASSILIAICNYIAQKIKAKTIVSTHLLDVAKKAKNAQYLEVSYIDLNTRKIKKGINLDSNAYEVALLSGIDKSIVDEAKKYALGQI